MHIRNELKTHIVQEGRTINEVVRTPVVVHR